MDIETISDKVKKLEDGKLVAVMHSNMPELTRELAKFENYKMNLQIKGTFIYLQKNI